MNSPADLSLFRLCVLLDSKLGSATWALLQPETIMIELDCYEPILIEKLRVLQVLTAGVMAAISKPEFLFWMTAVANGEFAEFEHIQIPSSLELAWCLVEAKKISALFKETWAPSEELKAVVEYVLNEDGFSEAPYPFEFLGPTFSLLKPGQTEQDTLLKAKALRGYIDYMESKQQ